jgi:hypothetical protein
MRSEARGGAKHLGADRWCAQKCGDPNVCYREHCTRGGRLGLAKGRVGKLKYECVVCHKHEMQFNAGDEHWMVWRCFCNCDRRAIRDGLLRLGIDPLCLGGYYSDSHLAYLEREAGGGQQPARRPDPELLAASRKYEALQKLISDEGTALVQMAARRIDEGDGSLPGILGCLIPRHPDQYAEFIALARRAGIGRPRYLLAERWFGKQAAGAEASE